MTIGLRAALLASFSLSALTVPAVAQDAPAEEEAVVSDIIVTGTRRVDRSVADSPVPVDIISSEQLSASGLGETNKILNQLIPSFNFPQPSVNDGTDVLRPATLRGLSPDQTLVLINGKRRHVSALLNINGSIGRGSAAVDLNLVPGLAIDRIEVLRDGASSQYGSDAIAGVINIQLKKSDNGGRASVSYGKYLTTMEGVPEFAGLQLNAGQPLLDPADTRVLASTFGKDDKRNDGALTTYAVNFGLPIGAGGFFNITGEYRDRNATNRAGFDTRPNYNRPTAAFDPREATFNRLNFKIGDAKTEDLNFFVNGGVPVGDLDLYVFGSYGQRDGLSAANYRQANAAANRDFSTITPSTTPNAANFTALTADGFLPLIDTNLEDYAGTVGLKGEVLGFNADLSVGYGHNSFDYIVRDSLNTSFGTASQRVFDAGGLRYGQITVNADFNRQYEIGTAKPLSVAIGYEYRNENFKIRPGEFQSFALGPLFRADFVTTAANCATQGGNFTIASGLCAFPGRKAGAGAQGFPGIPTSAATDESRDSVAAYIEFDTDLAEGLTTTLAGRYEYFTDFGSTVNGKFAVRYEPTEGYAIRGSISNGFRAPSLHQQFFTTISTNFISGVPVDILTAQVGSPAARALGSKDLKPEKSINLSVGFTANPTPGLNFTFDYYKISIDDRIVLTENLGASGSGNTTAVNNAIQAVLNGAGFSSVGAARFFINGLDTTTRGFDAVLSYRIPEDVGIGNWTVTAAYNNNKTKIDKRLNPLGPLATIPGINLFGRVEGLRFTAGQPRDKIVLSADGKIGDFGATLRTTRYGRVIQPANTNPIANPLSLTDLGPDDAILGKKWVSDLELRYTFMDRFDIAIGANNIFDVYPDRLPTGARAAAVGGQFPVNQYYFAYPTFSPFGFNGRFLYARAGVKF